MINLLNLLGSLKSNESNGASLARFIDLMESVLSSNELADLLAFHLMREQGVRVDEPLPTKIIEDGVIIYESSSYLLTLRIGDGTILSPYLRKLVEFPANSFVIGNYSRSDLGVIVYRQERVTNSGALSPPSTINIPAYRAAEICGDEYAVNRSSYMMHPHLMLVDIRNHPSIRYHFDTESGIPRFTTVGSPDDSSLKTMIELLGRIDAKLEINEPRLSVLRKFTDHSEAFIRWTAIQAICQVDFTSGAKCLEAAQNDSDHRIASLASRILRSEGNQIGQQNG